MVMISEKINEVADENDEAEPTDIFTSHFLDGSIVVSLTVVRYIEDT